MVFLYKEWNVSPYFKTRIKVGNLHDTYNRCYDIPDQNVQTKKYPVCYWMAFQSWPFVYLWQSVILERYYLHACTLHNFVLYLTISNNTQHSKGAYGSKLKDLILGKTFYRKTIFKCTLFKRLFNIKIMSKFVNWWILKASYFLPGLSYKPIIRVVICLVNIPFQRSDRM